MKTITVVARVLVSLFSSFFSNCGGYRRGRPGEADKRRWGWWPGGVRGSGCGSSEARPGQGRGVLPELEMAATELTGVGEERDGGRRTGRGEEGDQCGHDRVTLELCSHGCGGGTLVRPYHAAADGGGQWEEEEDQ